MRPHYSDFWKAGYAVIPEREGAPVKGLQWSRIWKEDWRPSKKELSNWDRSTTASYGLVCGKASGIVAIDFDINDEGKIKSTKKD